MKQEIAMTPQEEKNIRERLRAGYMQYGSEITQRIAYENDITALLAALDVERKRVAGLIHFVKQCADGDLFDGVQRARLTLAAVDDGWTLTRDTALVQAGLDAAASLALHRHERWHEAQTDHEVACDVSACEDISDGIRALSATDIAKGVANDAP